MKRFFVLPAAVLLTALLAAAVYADEQPTPHDIIPYHQISAESDFWQQHFTVPHFAKGGLDITFSNDTSDRVVARLEIFMHGRYNLLRSFTVPPYDGATRSLPHIPHDMLLTRTRITLQSADGTPISGHIGLSMPLTQNESRDIIPYHGVSSRSEFWWQYFFVPYTLPLDPVLTFTNRGSDPARIQVELFIGGNYYFIPDPFVVYPDASETRTLYGLQNHPFTLARVVVQTFDGWPVMGNIGISVPYAQ